MPEAGSPRQNGGVNVRYRRDDAVIWAPAEHTDSIFRALVELHERRHDLPSGIVWGDDEAHVDPARFDTFATAIVGEWETVGSTVYHQLVDGFVASVQVIAERCGLELDVGDEAYALALAARHNM